MSQMPQPAIRSGYFVRFFDLARSYQSLLSLSQPILGAIIALKGFPSARIFILGLLAATFGYLAVFSLNDILDRKIDRESISIGKAERDKEDIGVVASKHPLAHGDLSLAASIIWVASLSIASGYLAYILNPMCLWLFLGCVALEMLYCSLRSVTWLKTIPTGIMVGMGGLAGWAAVAPLTKGSIYFFLFLALWEIAGRNLANDMADVDSDREVGIKTVAATFGNRATTKAILIGAWAMIALTVTLQLSAISVLALLGAGILSMGLPAISLVREPSSAQASSYFNKASMFPLAALVVLIPLMLLRAL